MYGHYVTASKSGILNGFVVERFGRSAVAEGRKRPFSDGWRPVGFEADRRFGAYVERHAAVGVHFHFAGVVGGQRCAVGVTVDKGEGGPIVGGQRPELLLPVILMCTGWSYGVFRGKARADTGYH
jgi:hypothetical protein